MEEIGESEAILQFREVPNSHPKAPVLRSV